MSGLNHVGRDLEAELQIYRSGYLNLSPLLLHLDSFALPIRLSLRNQPAPFWWHRLICISGTGCLISARHRPFRAVETFQKTVETSLKYSSRFLVSQPLWPAVYPDKSMIFLSSHSIQYDFSHKCRAGMFIYSLQRIDVY